MSCATCDWCGAAVDASMLVIAAHHAYAEWYGDGPDDPEPVRIGQACASCIDQHLRPPAIPIKAVA
jgi:hypothetical protein